MRLPNGSDWTAPFRLGADSATRHSTSQHAHSTAADAAPTGQRLTFFIPDMSVGGAEQVVVNIVNGLSARGYDVELLLSRTRGELQPELASHVTVVELPPTPLPVLGVATHLPALVSYLNRTNPAALFPHLNHTSIVCLAAKKLSDADTKVIPTQHSSPGVSDDQTLKGRVVLRLCSQLYPSADRIIAVSEGVAETLVDRLSVQREIISVLHNPIEVDAVRERARDPVDHRWVEEDETDVILFVGRLAEQKDLETWLRTFERVHEQHPATRGILVGKGSERERLSALADELGLSDVVSIPGYVENPYRFMKQADVFLLSSQYEGLPTVLIEALACGCPIVSTDCPSGPREILADGEYGTLAPVGDVDALADGVRTTLADPVAADKLQRRADDFAPDAVFDDYEQFIEQYVETV